METFAPFMPVGVGQYFAELIEATAGGVRGENHAARAQYVEQYMQLRRDANATHAEAMLLLGPLQLLEAERTKLSASFDAVMAEQWGVSGEVIAGYLAFVGIGIAGTAGAAQRAQGNTTVEMELTQRTAGQELPPRSDLDWLAVLTALRATGADIVVPEPVPPLPPTG